MINPIIDWAIERRWAVLAAVVLFAMLGVVSLFRLPIDAVPDITNIQVQINTEAEGYSPLEAEQRLTYVIETAMAGLPALDYTRSLSRYGLSQVTVVFEEGTDIYWARQQVSERLQSVRDDLPAGLTPSLGPIASGLGEIFTYVVRARAGAQKPDGSEYTLEDLRGVQDWIIRPQLVKVPGVTEINSVGGYEREYEVVPDPLRLLAFELTVSDLVDALKRNNLNAGAGYIERNGEQWLVRSPGQLANLDDIAQVVLAKRDDAPVRVRDVASVGFGKQLRTGAASLNGTETVLGTAFMLLGENSRTVSKALAQRLEEVNRSLPEGVEALAFYDRTTLVEKTISTVRKNLFEGAVLVIAVMFALLGNFTAAFVAALVIPLSMLFAVTGMVSYRVSGNLMSLGAIDFGLIVDGAVIVVENAVRRLSLARRERGRDLDLPERLAEVRQSTREVIRPALFGVFIIMLVYIPIFALTGVEGKMFQPMAFTVVAALAGAMVFSVTFVPAATAVFVRGSALERENAVMRGARRLYAPLLKHSVRRPLTVILPALALVLLSLWQATRMGTEFLPQLDEHDVALHALRIPGTGLAQSIEMQQLLETEIGKLAEVERVFSKIGTPEIATDPMPPSVADTILLLKPRRAWPDPDKSKPRFIDELRTLVESIPGNKYELTQPIEMRFNELIAGVRADLALRIYGDDLDVLADLGDRAAQILAAIPGSRDARAEQMKGLPMISVYPEQDHMALLGLDVEQVQDTVRTLVSGLDTGLIYDGDRRYRLVVRMHGDLREDPLSMARVPVALSPYANPQLKYVPLGEVARIEETQGPNQINRESGKRNVVVTANIEGRDLGSFVAEVQRRLRSQLELPSGYWFELGGTFEQLQSAQARLSLVVPVTLLLILGLLYSAFNSLRDALIVFSGVPLALTGGVAALAVRGMPISISALVGFIALSGIAVLNGVVMLSFIRDLRSAGKSLMEAVLEGAGQRLRPVLMTALVASLGFVPMAFNVGTGAEVQRPLATVVIGGILSSTLLTLLVLPALYVYVRGRRRKLPDMMF